MHGFGLSWCLCVRACVRSSARARACVRACSRASASMRACACVTLGSSLLGGRASSAVPAEGHSLSGMGLGASRVQPRAGCCSCAAAKARGAAAAASGRPGAAAPGRVRLPAGAPASARTPARAQARRSGSLRLRRLPYPRRTCRLRVGRRSAAGDAAAAVPAGRSAGPCWRSQWRIAGCHRDRAPVGPAGARPQSPLAWAARVGVRPANGRPTLPARASAFNALRVLFKLTGKPALRLDMGP
jgi:hypothetical protein